MKRGTKQTARKSAVTSTSQGSLKRACTQGGSSAAAAASLIQGVLTPRMHYRLFVCAETSGDYADDMMPSFERFKPLDDLMTIDENWLINHVPVSIRCPMFKSFACGWSQCFKAIANVLRRKQLPTVSAVEQELRSGREFDSRYTSFYFDKGGKVEFALDAILHRSMEEHEVHGDGSFFETFEEDTLALPSHPFDDDYGRIREALSIQQGGLDGEDSDSYDVGSGGSSAFEASATASANRSTRPSSVGWESWPVVESGAWGLVFVSPGNGHLGGQFVYYDDNDGPDEEEACVYLGAPLSGACYGVPRSCLRQPPFEGDHTAF